MECNKTVYLICYVVRLIKYPILLKMKKSSQNSSSMAIFIKKKKSKAISHSLNQACNELIFLQFMRKLSEEKSLLAI